MRQDITMTIDTSIPADLSEVTDCVQNGLHVKVVAITVSDPVDEC